MLFQSQSGSWKPVPGRAPEILTLSRMAGRRLKCARPWPPCGRPLRLTCSGKCCKQSETFSLPQLAAPAVGCSFKSPKSGLRAGDATQFRREQLSKPPRRTFSRLLPLRRCRGGFVQVHGNLDIASRFQRRTLRAMAAQSSSVAASSGIKGTTSAAPSRGCTPR